MVFLFCETPEQKHEKKVEYEGANMSLERSSYGLKQCKQIIQKQEEWWRWLHGE